MSTGGWWLRWQAESLHEVKQDDLIFSYLTSMQFCSILLLCETRLLWKAILDRTYTELAKGISCIIRMAGISLLNHIEKASCSQCSDDIHTLISWDAPTGTILSVCSWQTLAFSLSWMGTRQILHFHYSNIALPSGDAQARAETGSVFWKGCEWREPQPEINTALPHHPHTCVPVMETADACRNNGPLHGPDSPWRL